MPRALAYAADARRFFTQAKAAGILESPPLLQRRIAYGLLAAAVALMAFGSLVDASFPILMGLGFAVAGTIELAKRALWPRVPAHWRFLVFWGWLPGFFAWQDPHRRQISQVVPVHFQVGDRPAIQVVVSGLHLRGVSLHQDTGGLVLQRAGQDIARLPLLSNGHDRPQS